MSPSAEADLTRVVAVAGPPPLPSVRQKVADALVALSLADLCFVGAWFPPLYDLDQGFYNKLPLTTPTLLALAANLGWFALLVWLALQARRRFQRRWLHFALHLAFFVCLLLPLEFCRVRFLTLHAYLIVAWLRQPMFALLALAGLATVLWQHRRVARVATVLVGILSPLAFFNLAKIVLLSLGLEHLAQHASEPSLPPPRLVSPTAPRVVWVIFDELDQRLTFEQRPPGLQLPEFDRLRAEAIYATNAYPPGDGTSLSIPALTSGYRLSAVEVENASDLLVTLADTGEVTSWSKLPSVFVAARELGVNTALVGWYLPYPRILGRGLNFCEWYPHPGFESARAPTFGAALRREIACLGSVLYGRYLYANLCQSSLAASLAVITNDTYGLIFLHLPPPHNPGVYSPEKGRFTLLGTSRVTGYFNNVCLADHMFAQLRDAMAACTQWDRTWVILSADHSWRHSRLYDGRRDTRVPFLVRPPRVETPAEFAPELNTVLSHDLVLAILRGQLTNGPATLAWLEARRAPQRPVPDPRALD